MKHTSNVETLCSAWLAAKSDEAIAVQRRREIEAQLVAAIGAPMEGAETHHIGMHKVTLSQPVTRKLDVEAWDSVSPLIAPNLHPVRVKTIVEPDPAGCRYLAANEPSVWAIASRAITTTPGKVGVKIEVKKDGN